MTSFFRDPTHKAKTLLYFTKKVSYETFFLALVCCGFFSSMSLLDAAYIWKGGKFFNEKYSADASCEEHFQRGLLALQERKMDTAQREFLTIEHSFPTSRLAIDALYYLGVIKFEQSELDVANKFFSQYLQKKNTPDHFEDVYRYKLAIASRLAGGEKRHLFGYESLPKLMTGRQIALDIFDEIIKAMPYQEIAAQAMIEKGTLLIEREDFSKARDCFQEIIRKFPKTAFALTAFQAISECYSKQLQLEPQNNDALSLAEINILEAKKMFFSAEEIVQLSKQVENMRENFAKSLYETANLYERMDKPKAAVMCYATILYKFPLTQAAKQSQQRMKELSTYAQELSITVPN